jgi:hypothetical protein
MYTNSFNWLWMNMTNLSTQDKSTINLNPHQLLTLIDIFHIYEYAYLYIVLLNTLSYNIVFH